MLDGRPTNFKDAHELVIVAIESHVSGVVLVEEAVREVEGLGQTAGAKFRKDACSQGTITVTWTPNAGAFDWDEGWRGAALTN